MKFKCTGEAKEPEIRGIEEGIQQPAFLKQLADVQSQIASLEAKRPAEQSKKLVTANGHTKNSSAATAATQVADKKTVASATQSSVASITKELAKDTSVDSIDNEIKNLSQKQEELTKELTTLDLSDSKFSGKTVIEKTRIVKRIFDAVSKNRKEHPIRINTLIADNLSAEDSAAVFWALNAMEESPFSTVRMRGVQLVSPAKEFCALLQNPNFPYRFYLPDLCLHDEKKGAGNPIKTATEIGKHIAANKNIRMIEFLNFSVGCQNVDKQVSHSLLNLASQQAETGEAERSACLRAIKSTSSETKVVTMAMVAASARRITGKIRVMNGGKIIVDDNDGVILPRHMTPAAQKHKRELSARLNQMSEKELKEYGEKEAKRKREEEIAVAEMKKRLERTVTKLEVEKIVYSLATIQRDKPIEALQTISRGLQNVLEYTTKNCKDEDFVTILMSQFILLMNEMPHKENIRFDRKEDGTVQVIKEEEKEKVYKKLVAQFNFLEFADKVERYHGQFEIEKNKLNNAYTAALASRNPNVKLEVVTKQKSLVEDSAYVFSALMMLKQALRTEWRMNQTAAAVTAVATVTATTATAAVTTTPLSSPPVSLSKQRANSIFGFNMTMDFTPLVSSGELPAGFTPASPSTNNEGGSSSASSVSPSATAAASPPKK